jgi:hypothetical protein
VGTILLAGLIHVILASKELLFNFLNEGTFFTIAGAAQMGSAYASMLGC